MLFRSSPYAVDGYQELAKLRLAAGRPQQAAPYLERALGLGIHRDVSHYLLGYCYLNEGHFEEALTHFHQAAALSPENGQYALDVGRTLLKMQRYEAATSVFEKILEKDPEHFPAYLLMMKSEELSGHPSKAVEWARVGLARARGKDFQSAVLTAAVMQLAYRQGWKALMHDMLNALSERYSKVPWYGDLAAFLTGKTDEKGFILLVRSKYPGFKDEARKYVQMRREIT